MRRSTCEAFWGVTLEAQHAQVRAAMAKSHTTRVRAALVELEDLGGCGATLNWVLHDAEDAQAAAEKKVRGLEALRAQLEARAEAVGRQAETIADALAPQDEPDPGPPPGRQT